jgi:FG-GAP-like repeat
VATGGDSNGGTGGVSAGASGSAGAGGAGGNGSAGAGGAAVTSCGSPAVINGVSLFGDFDGDGLTDCVQSDVGVGPLTSYNLLFHKGVAQNQYLASAVVTPNVLGVPMKVMDLNHDGRQDLVVCAGVDELSDTRQQVTSYGHPRLPSGHVF